ncbi:MAG: phosphotransferase family protein [Burkholderiales bacterium]|jgi:aminoglycoside phosphotransferase (APT) family kinase protein|nr:phosphotransferase family protein [Burkholderiales bacterium]
MSQLQEVTERHRFDADRLADYLAGQLPGFVGPLTVRQFQGGQSNPTYLLSTPGRRYVMRSKPGPAARLLASAHAIEREFRVMRALASQDVPVPDVLLLCEDESVIGRAFFVMEHIDGRILWDPSLPGLAPAERAAVYDEMNRVIAALHAVDVEAAGLADYGKAGNYFARQIGRWSKQYRASETAPIDAMDRLIEWLPANVPAGDETTVVHGDFRLDNLIFDPAQARVLAVIDWELSTLGHPLADFSYLCMSWHIPPGAFRGIAGLDHAALGIPSEAGFIDRYCRRTGRVGIEHWDFYLAYNLFRIAAILQGVYKRALDGMASADNAAAAGGNARTLAEIGWRYARRSAA